MNIAKLLDELRCARHVEVVVSLLPKMSFLANQSPRNSLLQGFQRIGEAHSFWLADQKVHMIRHDNVAMNYHSKRGTNPL